MTQETKLGLFIGGIFILCFAMILSNHEGENNVEDQVATLLDTFDAAPSVSESARSGRVESPAVEPTLTAVPQNELARSSQPDARPTPAATQRTSQQTAAPDSTLPGQEVIATGEPVADTLLRQSTPANFPPPHSMAADAIDNTPLVTLEGRLPEAEHTLPMTTTEAARREQEQLAAQTSTEEAAQPETTAPPKETSTVKTASHTVAKGDSLIKIARKYYGHSSSADIDRIYQANRNMLSDRHSVKVGQKLIIPLPETQETGSANAQLLQDLQRLKGQPLPPKSSKESTPPIPAALKKVAPEKINPEPSTAPTQPEESETGWVWYQVQPNDRLSTIARRELGDEKRWKEIYELNRHIFKDPNQIRPGVRIKLPKVEKNNIAGNA